MIKKPWAIHPDLTLKRITIIGNIIAGIRGEVVDLHDEAIGDTPKSLGMRAYECCRSRLNKSGISKAWPWFSVLTPDGRCTFQIGKVPVRFTRNDPEQLPSRKLLTSEECKGQLSLFKDEEFSKIRFFFVVDTYYKNAADNMYFVGYNEHGKIVSSCDIQIQTSPVSLAAMPPSQNDAVVIQPARIKVKKPKVESSEVNNE